MHFTFYCSVELIKYTQTIIPKYLCSWKLCGMKHSHREICCTSYTQWMPKHTGLHFFSSRTQRDRRKCHSLEALRKIKLKTQLLLFFFLSLRGNIPWLKPPFLSIPMQLVHKEPSTKAFPLDIQWRTRWYETVWRRPAAAGSVVWSLQHS